LVARGHIVNQDSELIPQALVIVLIAFFDDALEGVPQGQDRFLVSRHRLNGRLPNHFNHVPDRFD